MAQSRISLMRMVLVLALALLFVREVLAISVVNDPIVTGFDNVPFHFNELGEHCLMEEASGWRVDATFAGAPVEEGEAAVAEKSWTSAIRVFAPNGDMVSCALPAIKPNTARMQMTATPIDGDVQLLSTANPGIELRSGLSAFAILSEGEHPQVVGCTIITPTLDITVRQINGAVEAAKHSEEAWAAPFTWLNVEWELVKPLAVPVTGVIGSTYPIKQTAEGTISLHPELEVEGASMEGEPVVESRRLLSDFGTASMGATL